MCKCMCQLSIYIPNLPVGENKDVILFKLIKITKLNK